MKSINQIFKNKKSLLEEKEVQELIEYCRELEGEVMDQNIGKDYNKEHVYIHILKDIMFSLREIKKQEQENQSLGIHEEIDHKACIENLYDYMMDAIEKNKIKL